MICRLDVCSFLQQGEERCLKMNILLLLAWSSFHIIQFLVEYFLCQFYEVCHRAKLFLHTLEHHQGWVFKVVLQHFWKNLFRSIFFFLITFPEHHRGCHLFYGSFWVNSCDRQFLMLCWSVNFPNDWNVNASKGISAPRGHAKYRKYGYHQESLTK